MAELLPPMSFWEMMLHVNNRSSEIHVEFPEDYRDENPAPAWGSETKGECK